MSNMTCGELAKELGKLPMQIGRVKNEVCDESDLDGSVDRLRKLIIAALVPDE